MLDLGDVFIHTQHRYEVVLENLGEIDVPYQQIPLQSAFASKFNFTPASGVLGVGQKQVFQIDFRPTMLGQISEDFVWELQVGVFDYVFITL